MNKIVRYVGIMLVLLGALILILYYLGVFGSNAALATAGVTMILGVIAHVILNKRFMFFACFHLLYRFFILIGIFAVFIYCRL